jgi:hypothetical protein
VLKSGAFTAADADRYDIEQTVYADVLDPAIAARLASDRPVALVVVRRKRDQRGQLTAVGIHTHPADRYQLRTRIRPSRVELSTRPDAPGHDHPALEAVPTPSTST